MVGGMIYIAYFNFMDKKLLTCESDWELWIKTEIMDDYLSPEKPLSYPCITTWTTWDIRGSRHDGCDIGYVYIEDFVK